MSNATAPVRFVKNVMHNGIGRHVCQLQRITFSFCKEQNTSRGVSLIGPLTVELAALEHLKYPYRFTMSLRDFIENYLLDFVKGNPGIVVYLMPKRHRKPYIQADYLNGYSEKVNLAGLKQELVCEWVGQMRGRSGVQIQRLMKDWHTDTPSVQSVWQPFYFKDSKLSVMDLRDKSLHEFKPLKKSATEKVLKLFNEQQKELQDSDAELPRNLKIAASG